MQRTRVLSPIAVTLDTLKAAVNLRFSGGEHHVIVTGNSRAERLQSSVALAPLDAGVLWIFLEGRAFAHTLTNEVYACLIIPGPNGVNPSSLLRNQLTAMYEEFITRLPDFNGDAPGSWCLAVEFQAAIQYIYVEYLPNDPSGKKWSLSTIHEHFADYSW